MFAVGRAVGVGKAFVVEVVEEADDPPRLRVGALADGHRAHGAFDGVHVLAEGLRGGPLLHQFEGVGAVHRDPRCVVRGTCYVGTISPSKLAENRDPAAGSRGVWSCRSGPEIRGSPGWSWCTWC